MGQSHKPDPEPAAAYLLERFVDLNEAHKEELDILRPGLWGRLCEAVKGQRDAYVTETELFHILTRQTRYASAFGLLNFAVLINFP